MIPSYPMGGGLRGPSTARTPAGAFAGTTMGSVGLAMITVVLLGAVAAGPQESRSGLQQAEPLAVQELAPGVRLEIMELKRVTGGLVHLSFAVVNESAEVVSLRTWGFSYISGSAWVTCGVSLLDLSNLKRHRAGNCSLSADVPPQSRREFWAQYMAPPDDVTAATIEVPGAPLIYDLTIGS